MSAVEVQNQKAKVKKFGQHLHISFKRKEEINMRRNEKC